MTLDIASVTLKCDAKSRNIAWRTALLEGRAAGRAGLSKKARPYPFGTPAGAGWYCGWCDFVEFGPAQLSFFDAPLAPL